MAQCIHDFEQELCGDCAATARGSCEQSGSMVGHSFALIYAPSIRRDTFVHLNRQGDSWKIRRYLSPSRPAEEIAQAGERRTKLVVDLDSLEIVHHLDYPHSRMPLGVTIEDSRYWFDEIVKANATYGISATGADA